MVDLKFRVKGPYSSAIVTCSSESSLGNLRDLISKTLSLEKIEFDLFSGFPTKKVDQELKEMIGLIFSTNEIIFVRLRNSDDVEKLPQMDTSQNHLPNVTNSARRINSISPATSQRPRIATLSNPSGRGPIVGRRRTKKISTSSTLGMTTSPEEDLSVRLLSAAQGGRSSIDKALRSDLKRALQLQYSVSSAEARITAALCSAYTIEDDPSSRTLGSSGSSGRCTKQIIKYHKGIGYRRGSSVTESVDLLDRDTIRGAIRVILGDQDEKSKENLRPIHMAGVSPRIFWSLVRIFGGEAVVSGRALGQLFPDVDFSWMSVRHRELSDKAKANRLQLQEREEGSRARKRARKQAVEGGTPDAQATEAVQTEQQQDYDGSVLDWVELLVSAARMSELAVNYPEGWRDRLTDRDPSDPLAAAIRAATTEGNLTAGSRDMLLLATWDGESQNIELRAGVEAARQAVFDSAWREICCRMFANVASDASNKYHSAGGKALEVAAKLGISGLNSLALWRHCPDTLLREIHRLAPAHDSALTADSLRALAELAHTLLQRCSWMDQRKFSVAESGDGEEDASYDSADENDDEEDEDEERRRLESEGWMVVGREPSQTELALSRGRGGGCTQLGASVGIALTGDGDGKVDVNGVGSVIVSGRVIAFLAATEEEPMALWRVRHPVNEDGAMGRTDLEENELHEALSRCPEL